MCDRANPFTHHIYKAMSPIELEHKKRMLAFALSKEREEVNEMPIVKGHSQKSISKNIRTLYRDFKSRGYSKAKALRMAQGAAYTTAKTAAKKAGVRPSHLRKS
jgi:hypothetical protein